MKNARFTAAILAVLLSVAMLLTACKGSATPSGNESTGDSAAAPATSATSTPAVTESSTPEVGKTFVDEPLVNEEAKSKTDTYISYLNDDYNINVDSLLDGIRDKYGKYLNENITKTAVRIAMVLNTTSVFTSKTNLTGISDVALNKVNTYLKENGEQKLDSANHEENIAALWIAASLYYDPDLDESGELGDSMAMAFALACADNSRSDVDDVARFANTYWSYYVWVIGG